MIGPSAEMMAEELGAVNLVLLGSFFACAMGLADSLSIAGSMESTQLVKLMSKS